MAQCIHCHAAKGKRPCPALQGSICSPCCGKHRRHDIACPSDCPYLPAPESEVRNKANSYQRVVDHLAADVRQRPLVSRVAAEEFLGGKREAAEWEDGMLMAYILYGHVDMKGERLIDAFSRERGARLLKDEREALEALAAAYFGMFEVKAVRRDEGMTLQNLVTDECVEVAEKLGTHQTVKYDVRLAWVMTRDGHQQFTGAVCDVPRDHKLVVLNAVLHAMAEALRQPEPWPRGHPNGYLALTAHRTLCEALANVAPPLMRNMDDENIMFCESRYEVSDTQAVTDKLSSHNDLEHNEDEWAWLDHKGRPLLGKGPLVLGNITLKGTQLILHTRSRERMEKGKKLLAKLLGKLASHRADVLQDPDAALDEHEARSGGTPALDESISPEIVQELIVPMLRDQAHEWLDTKLPALGSKTPRRAVKTTIGRMMVLDLLKNYENSLLRLPGGEHVDFDAIYRELGLERD